MATHPVRKKLDLKNWKFKKEINADEKFQCLPKYTWRWIGGNNIARQEINQRLLLIANTCILTVRILLSFLKCAAQYLHHVSSLSDMQHMRTYNIILSCHLSWLQLLGFRQDSVYLTPARINTIRYYQNTGFKMIFPPEHEFYERCYLCMYMPLINIYLWTKVLARMHMLWW